ncbi:MAG: hypothetical protein LBO21_02855 [Synergistaceae bacterium]|nr:hypothetical protein [Synergistaceae bacterium]
MADAQTRWVKLVAGEQVKEGRVTSIAADDYVINIGLSRGVNVGDYYLVHYDGGDIYDINGALMGVYKVPVALLKVRSVSASESTCEVTASSQGWAIQGGDRVVQISESNANKLKFATFRSALGNSRPPDRVGRWTREFSSDNPMTVLVKYFSAWTVPGFQLIVPPAPAGFYYTEAPVLPPFNISVVKVPAVLPDPSLAVVHVAEAPVVLQTPPQPVPPPPPPPAVYQAPVPPVPPLYQPFPPSMPNFDVNQISDVRLVRTFPLTQVEMYALEIQHRGAWNLYSNKRYLEAFSAFCKQALEYNGNYLSAYWAGVCALKLEDTPVAVSWFGRALDINPYYQPAIKELSDISNKANQPKQASQPAKTKAKTAPAKAKTAPKAKTE